MKKFFKILLIVLIVGGTMGMCISLAEQNITAAIILGNLAGIPLLGLIIYCSTPSYKGKAGERQVASMLAKVAKKKHGYVINDIIIPDVNNEGKTSQIDHIILTNDFIAAIETKNWSGMIYGKEEDREWTQVLANGNVKHSKYNPVKQNFTHMCRLVDLLEFKHGVVDSFVCFPKADITHVHANNVFNIPTLKHYLMTADSKHFTDQELQWYLEMLTNLKEHPIQTNREHVKEIHKMQKDVEKGICPRCGGKLVLRTNSKGQQFYGCSNYPKCKFIKKY